MSVCEPEGGYPGLGAYFEPGERGQQPFTPFDVLLLRFFGQTHGLGERLMFIIFREDHPNLADITGDAGVDPLLGRPSAGECWDRR